MISGAITENAAARGNCRAAVVYNHSLLIEALMIIYVWMIYSSTMFSYLFCYDITIFRNDKTHWTMK